MFTTYSPRTQLNILLGITGSVSAYKTPWLVRDLVRGNHDVRVVATASAVRFVTPLALEATSKYPTIVDPFDSTVQQGGSWHVHLAEWADVMLIAPCSATTLAKLATAQADSSVTLVACSLPKETPLIVAPAMDSYMWLQPATQRNVRQLQQDGVVVLEPDHGELASGLTGYGRLPEIESLVAAVANHSISTTAIAERTPMRATGGASPLHALDNTAQPSILITAGPTHEPIDAVRSIVNHSTGTMGFALAQAAAERGMLVTLVSGPVTLPTPAGVHRIDVQTAAQMFDAVCKQDAADISIMAAAVADFTPAEVHQSKIKKDSTSNGELTIQLKPTADILRYVGSHKTNEQVVVGFALETNDVLQYATNKLHSKNADIMVANQAGIEHSGFGTGMNTITLITGGVQTPYPPMSKRACAEVILDAALDAWQRKQKQTPPATE